MRKGNCAARLVIAFFCAVLSCSSLQAAEIVSVETSNSRIQTVLGSSVIPYKEVTLSAQIPGVLKYFAGEVGSSYQQGAVLTQVDEAQLVAKRNAVLAQIQNAQSLLQSAQAQYQREIISPRSRDIGAMPGFGMPAMMDNFITRPMADMMLNNYDSDMGRYSDLVTSASGVSQARGSLQQAYSQLQEIDAALLNAKGIAPFEGVILQKMAEVGDTVQVGQPLLRYGFVKYKRLQADVPASLMSQVTMGMVVPVKINRGVETMAKVSQIYPVADAEHHTVTVKFDLPVDVVAAPGMYAEIYLSNPQTTDEPVVMIPRTALLSGRSLPSVLVVENGSSSLRLVRLGAEYGNKVEIISGLKPGMKIMDNPPSRAVSGWMPDAQ
ncbi:efflux RND transporter periplasmic adaptor subunit [uncultured Thiothrix sp.]|uniref:efflux RND transporter periplasmic adaptor subunit n=1 Tax=uncultured Thiothrix sp. TaxID=223185 RepID=UPI002613E0FA|nr:efflux RND transporter periplasmic adaptor subunit [uncultured Thiothrix sp.]HMT91338.1 efflux RND transporter periplasmic adaptor subunit [Thiolinea sp.]